MADKNNFKITYTFILDSENIKRFNIDLDSKSLLINKEHQKSLPEWTKMNNFRCSNCPLDPDLHTFCPLAEELFAVIDFFKNISSYEEVEVAVETDERITAKHTSIQLGLSSLMGIIMSSSGCPVIGKLRSLVRFHLPFASLNETEYRVVSMYVFAQFLKMKKGKEPDWSLETLKSYYKEIQIVNRNIVEKISHIEINDSCRNAVVTLSDFAEYILMNLEGMELMKLNDYIFSFEENK